MDGAGPSQAGLYQAYREDVSGERMIRSLRTGALVVFCLNSGFILLDHWVYPDRFGVLLTVRLLLDAVMLICYWGAGRVKSSERILKLGPVLVGLGLIAVIGVAGGVTSPYYPGLMLLFLGMPVLLPLSVSQASGIVTTLLLGFAGLPLVTGWQVAWQDYAIHLFFPSAAALECVASCALLDRLRFADFLQRREIEEARDELAELDKAKSRFTANVHHELRTPLTLILAPLDALRGGEMGGLADPVKRLLDTMYTNGLRLLKQINNLLDLAKLESKQLAIRRRSSNLEELVGAVIEGARPLADRKGVALSTEGLDAVPEIYADGEALEKIVLNLVGNALKFTGSGGSIVVRAEPEGDGVHLSVIDTGVGIPANQVGRIFDRFAQVDSSASRTHEGTGIGLSLTLELVELHGGRVWAESEGEGCGAVMHVVLPRGEPDEGADEEEVLRSSEGGGLSLGDSIAASQSEFNLSGEDQGDYSLSDVRRSVERTEQESGSTDAPTLPAHSAATPEVLIVEDNPDMRRLIVMLVSREYRIRVARNGAEALDLVRDQLPDLVLTDVMMPEMTGTELCRAIKSDPETQAVPVMLVTSKAEREMKIEGLELGADDYVSKPFHPRELLARIHSLVRQRSLQKELEKRNTELETALSDLTAAEAQLVQSERLAAVGELAAGIAHEVNNPVNFALNALRAMNGSVERLREVADQVLALDWEDAARLGEQVAEFQRVQEKLGVGEVADTLAELVSIVSEGLDRTHRLVGDLRDFAAPGGGPEGRVDVARCLSATLQLLGHELRKVGAEVEVEIEKDLPLCPGDAAALNQVFLNLLKNAAEAMDEGGGSIQVRAFQRDGNLWVTVHDTGSGVPPELRERLFEPFFSTKEAGKGTGLGLSISRQIARSHGGDLELDSESSRGSTFILRLPVLGAADSGSGVNGAA